MPDSQINRLDETLSLNALDYVAFDVSDTNTGQFYTKKVSFSTINRVISGVVVDTIQKKLDILDKNIIEAKQTALLKLDRRGINLDRQIERMIGPLVLNSYLSALSTSYFERNVHMHMNNINYLADPISDYDAVNKSYLISYTSSKFLYLTGGTMAGDINMDGYRVWNLPDLTVNSNLSDATNKKYVDSEISNLASKKLSLSGQETMSGFINMGSNKITNLTTPTDNTDAANKIYVDSEISNLASKKLSLSGQETMSGFINMGSNKITNLTTPTDNTDAANKVYVDGQVSNLASKKLSLSGQETMSGFINMGSNKITNLATPTINNDAANKVYVDGQVATRLPLAGGTMSGPINMGSNKITNLTTPTDNTDAANKVYVDSQTSTQISKKLSLSGQETMSGFINMGSNKITNLTTPTDNTDAANKIYVDSQVTSLGVNKTYVDTEISKLASKKLSLSGQETMSGFINMGSNKITNLTTPTDNTDATNKVYVDGQVATRLPLAGGTMTGIINMGGFNINNIPSIPTNNNSATSKSYVDDKITNSLVTKMNLSGGSFTGPVEFKSFSENIGNYISSTVGTPISSVINFIVSSGNTHIINMNNHIDSFSAIAEPNGSYSMTILFKQNNTTLYKVGNWKINNVDIKWANGGTPKPEITQILGRSDIIAFTKIGTDWFGFVGGQNFN
jgi:hypothetical protein